VLEKNTGKTDAEPRLLKKFKDCHSTPTEQELVREIIANPDRTCQISFSQHQQQQNGNFTCRMTRATHAPPSLHSFQNISPLDIPRKKRKKKSTEQLNSRTLHQQFPVLQQFRDSKTGFKTNTAITTTTSTGFAAATTTTTTGEENCKLT
jgi:hypothetical protein